MGAAATMPSKESTVKSVDSLKLGDLVVHASKGCRIEFITDKGESILVYIPEDLHVGQQVIARPVLSGDGKTERATTFQHYITLPAVTVTIDGEQVTRPEPNAKGKVVPANGIGYYDEGGKKLLIELYPAVFYHNGEASKESLAIYRSQGRSKDPGRTIVEVIPHYPEAETPSA